MKTVDFSETFAASDLKGNRSTHLIGFMKVCEYCIQNLVLFCRLFLKILSKNQILTSFFFDSV